MDYTFLRTRSELAIDLETGVYTVYIDTVTQTHRLEKKWKACSHHRKHGSSQIQETFWGEPVPVNQTSAFSVKICVPKMTGAGQNYEEKTF